MGYLEVAHTMEQTFGTGGGSRWGFSAADGSVVTSGKARDLGNDRGYRVAR
jgi:hypothetical protein